MQEVEGTMAPVVEEVQKKATTELDTTLSSFSRTAGERIQDLAAAAFEDFQKRTKDHSGVLLENLRRDSDALVTDVQKQLQQSARVFHEKSAEAIQNDLRKVIEEVEESSAARLRKHAEEYVDLVSEQLKEKQQLAVHEAENLLRNTLVEMLKKITHPGSGTGS